MKRSDDARWVLGVAAGCAARAVGLLARRRLHVRRGYVGDTVTTPDGRHFLVFRHTTCDRPVDTPPVMLTVRFHLRGVPARGHVRRWLFERCCIVNTLLFAGCDGYLVKLWMVDPATADYAGVYSWSSAEAADRYARYITAVLRPLSRPGSVGYEVSPHTTLDEYLRARP